MMLRAHARQAPWNARGLAAHVTALIDAAGIRPTNASARAIPSARAVRFYVATGLMDHPEGRGTAATYHYRHLLQLLAIKIRQREGRTLDGIRAELSGLAGDALERRVAAALGPALEIAAVAGQPDPMDQPTNWRRIVVSDGIEVTVRGDLPAASPATLIAMREAIRAAIARDDLD
ncbi:MAG: MerR family transcriptional regulator [Gemmatimonadaceae bacterium]|nr:MerR family transcriptional regulator [Gemmatimonadaceae bacterium]